MACMQVHEVELLGYEPYANPAVRKGEWVEYRVGDNDIAGHVAIDADADQYGVAHVMIVEGCDFREDK